MLPGSGHDLDLGRVHDLGCVHSPSHSHGLGRSCSRRHLVVVVEISKKEDSEKLR